MLLGTYRIGCHADGLRDRHLTIETHYPAHSGPRAGRRCSSRLCPVRRKQTDADRESQNRKESLHLHNDSFTSVRKFVFLKAGEVLRLPRASPRSKRINLGVVAIETCFTGDIYWPYPC